MTLQYQTRNIGCLNVTNTVHSIQKDGCRSSSEGYPLILSPAMSNRRNHSAFHPSSRSTFRGLFRSSSCLPQANPFCLPEAQRPLAHLSPEATETAAPKAEWLSPDTVAIGRDAPAEMLSPDSFGIEERHYVDVE